MKCWIIYAIEWLYLVLHSRGQPVSQGLTSATPPSGGETLGTRMSRGFSK